MNNTYSTLTRELFSDDRKVVFFALRAVLHFALDVIKHLMFLFLLI